MSNKAIMKVLLAMAEEAANNGQWADAEKLLAQAEKIAESMI